MGRGRRKVCGARDKGGGTSIEAGVVGMMWGGTRSSCRITDLTGRRPEVEGGVKGTLRAFSKEDPDLLL